MPDRRRASNLSVLADAVSSEDDDARAYRAFGPRKRRLVPEDVGVGLEVVRRFANGGMRCRVEEEVHAEHGRRVRVRWTTADEDDGLSMRQTLDVRELLVQLNGDRVAKRAVAPRRKERAEPDERQPPPLVEQSDAPAALSVRSASASRPPPLVLQSRAPRAAIKPVSQPTKSAKGEPQRQRRPDVGASKRVAAPLDDGGGVAAKLDVPAATAHARLEWTVPSTEQEWATFLNTELHRRQKGWGHVGSVLGLMLEPTDDAHASETLCAGTRVEACFAGDAWPYPGRIQLAREDGTYDIKYDDGGHEFNVPRRLIFTTAEWRGRRDWQQPGAWVEVEGRVGRIRTMPAALHALDLTQQSQNLVPRVIIHFDDGELGEAAHGAISPLLLVRYREDGTDQECISARHIRKVSVRQQAWCTVSYTGDRAAGNELRFLANSLFGRAQNASAAASVGFEAKRRERGLSEDAE